jgi:hypothetical protein
MTSVLQDGRGRNVRKIIAALLTSLDGSIVVQPIVLGRGKALFKDVKDRHVLTLLDARQLQSGMVRLTYRTGSSR